MSSSLKFGTSGLRGSVAALNRLEVQAYTLSFLRMLEEDGVIKSPTPVCVGQDLRPSSSFIAETVQRSIASVGHLPYDCGIVSTPALAFYSMKEKLPAVMVTGSHLCKDSNGLKFYNPWGEITKNEERRISILREGLHSLNCQESLDFPAERVYPFSFYFERYKNFFDRDFLVGLKVGVYQHSSVLRELLVETLSYFGAQVFAFGYSHDFVSFDTEAIDDRILDVLHSSSLERCDAIVSADCDGDRAFIIDENGKMLRGDHSGALTARYLNADAVVIPVHSNSALKSSDFGADVFVTRVGSPYVLAGIADALSKGYRRVLGFEPNGGLILGSDFLYADRKILALPTRDALLPILCCLALSVKKKKALSHLVQELGFRESFSTYIPYFCSQKAEIFFKTQQDISSSLIQTVQEKIGTQLDINRQDGLRMSGSHGDVVHFRKSGNGSGLRVYVEALEKKRARELLSWACFLQENMLL